MSYSAAVSPVIVVSYSGKGSLLKEGYSPGLEDKEVQIPETQVGAMVGQVKSSTQVKVSTTLGTQSPTELQVGADEETVPASSSMSTSSSSSSSSSSSTSSASSSSSLSFSSSSSSSSSLSLSSSS